MPEGRKGETPLRVIGAVAVGVAILGGAIGLWLWSGSRPVRLIIEPTPADALVRVGDHQARGRLEIDVDAGAIAIEISSPGHLPTTIRTSAEAGTELRLTPDLQPLPRR